ncbi:MAG: PEGA domain-containing protein [Salinivirgaceae bacterium]|nr:PEGA domain-containing protein [Salinivirgaceae bacterium]
MKKIVSIIAAIFCATAVFAQGDDNSISVASFKKLDNDLTARTQKKIDQNGEPCALIKVQVQSDGFIFEGDGLGIVTTVPKIDEGEYWVYVPRGAKYLTVKHKTLGVLRQYAYPVKIEKQCTYELRLSHKKIETEGNYLIISVEPKESAIYIDDEKLDSEIKSPFLQTGRHTYRVECEYYVTKTGNLTISKSERANLDVKLERAKGYLTVNYKPDGTDVLVDGKTVGKTPLRVRLEAGEHNLMLKSDLYIEETKTVKITQDAEIQVNGELKRIPSGFIKVRTNARGASIYIDDKLVGKTRGVFEFTAGTHTVYISKPGVIEKTSAADVKAGKTCKVIVKEPLPKSTAAERREARRAERQEARAAERQQNHDERVGKRYMSTGMRGFVGGGAHFTLDATDFKDGILADEDNNNEIKHESLVGTGAQVSASFGNNVKPFWYLGVGASYIFTATSTGHHCWAVPVYLDNRVEAFNRRVSPFVALRLGAGLPFSTDNKSYNAGQFYMSPSVGLRFGHLNVGVSYTNRMAVKYKDFKTPRTLSIGVVYDFGGRGK